MLTKLNPTGYVTAVFHMADQNGEENFPFELQTSSGVSFEKLEGAAYDASVARFGDGRAVALKNAYLSLNTYRARRLRPRDGKFTLYIRACMEADDHGCLFYSDFLSLSIHESGLAVAFLGVCTKEGKNYREIPLCRIARGEWLDLVLQADGEELRFYSNGVLGASYPLAQPLAAPFDDDMVIGGFRCLKPETYFTSEPIHRFRCCRIDTLALWDCVLDAATLAALSGVEALTKGEEDTLERRMYRAYNRFYDASVEGDAARCAAEWQIMASIAAKDPTRPAYHLTQPVGHIFDPVGATCYDGKYHVYSYRNLCYRLDYCSLDHYVSEDLTHWSGYPVGPFADAPCDVFSIFLLNHFLDDEGNPRVLYTGQGISGKCGVLARSDEHLITYTDKHVVLPRYHHDGHVFKRGNTWYTITSKLCKGKRPGGLGDALMLWASKDLEQWTEEGEIFCARKTDFDPEGFMEFPYLLAFGDKDVVIAGTKPVQYWVGHMDWERKRFIPDCEEGRKIDYTSAFPCFNPQCVDHKGVDGKERRILMVLYRDIGSRPDALTPWYGVHAQPRLLTFTDGRLCQAPLPEMEALRAGHADYGTCSLRGSAIQTLGAVGNCTEIRAAFTRPASGCVGVLLAGQGQSIRVVYDAARDVVSLNGTVNPAGGGPAYAAKEETIEMRVFLDRELIEVFVNGVSLTATATGLLAGDTTLSLASDGLDTPVVASAEAWELKPAYTQAAE